MPINTHKLRIASVSFLNARPLIEGLDRHPDVALTLDVPSRLLDGLRENRYDVALLPVIDYQRMDGLTILPAGGIGSDGATLTVRLFSRVPIAQIKSLACDPDSHTSVALARIILSRRYHLRPEFIDLGNATGNPHEARLLIGDKVVCDEPAGFEHQLDLGAEWKALTGLPFVFATWMARPGADLSRFYALLCKARVAGQQNIEQIIQTHAIPRGWPIDLARNYLTQHLIFHVGSREMEAMELFYRFAVEEGIIESARELRFWTESIC